MHVEGRPRGGNRGRSPPAALASTVYRPRPRAHGPGRESSSGVTARSIRETLEAIDGVECAVVYPVELDGATLTVAAVSQRDGAKALTSSALYAAFAGAD